MKNCKGEYLNPDQSNASCMEDILAIKEVTDQFINQNSDKHFFPSYLKFMNMKVDFSFDFIYSALEIYIIHKFWNLHSRSYPQNQWH
jgi:hypothetical protein